jgi:5-methyltetrahydropteroyltriglutamate--homocysteine methyltransferase
MRRHVARRKVFCVVQSTILGYPRIGRDRELKRACEAYWAGTEPAEALYATATALRKAHWETQRTAGIDLIPTNDFSMYDQVLDAIALVGAVPERYHWQGDTVDVDTYFAMARGAQRAGFDAQALEMTKWFDTNYHYLVPEWRVGQPFRLASTKLFDEVAEAQALGITPKPVLIGPFSLALLGKAHDGRVDLLGSILPGLVAVYGEILDTLGALGITWVQLDEPCLAQDRTPAELTAFRDAYRALAQHRGSTGQTKLLVQTYFGHVGESYATLAELPVQAIGLDLTRGRAQTLELLHHYGFPNTMTLVAGVIDGRNIWRADLDNTLDLLDEVATLVPHERLMVAPSSSLLHIPYDARREEGIDPEVRTWLAFADQKLSEVVTLTHALNEGRAAVVGALGESAAAVSARVASSHTHDAVVRTRLAEEHFTDRPSYAERRHVQDARLDLPLLPTTTIGSFPQTREVRRMRSRFEAGEITQDEYDRFLEEAIADAIARQEALGLDVLVHGEFERNDMVQYFGEQLRGFAFTHHGWVQSYGSRCVRPPIIYGDVSRPCPMTVRWSVYAQSLTDKPVKGMLTGPVTILNWSFVRDDQPRSETCRQIAFALKDEVVDLEHAGLRVIQIDEPALREGLPLRRSEWEGYLSWAVGSFRIAASGASSATQVHTHMCYSDFGDIIAAISALDADVLSIENSRSGGELLQVFRHTEYDKGIGPGVYDIHSPRVPSEQEVVHALEAIVAVLPVHNVWVNPDCGLKTRSWEEASPALERLVAAARRLRTESGTLA